MNGVLFELLLLFIVLFEIIKLVFLKKFESVELVFWVFDVKNWGYVICEDIKDLFGFEDVFWVVDKWWSGRLM